LLWLLRYLDPLLSSNLCVLSASSFLDDITTGFKLAISCIFKFVLLSLHIWHYLLYFNASYVEWLKQD
jgi:hypothetical protein